MTTGGCGWSRASGCLAEARPTHGVSNVKLGHLDYPVEVHGSEDGPPMRSMANTREHGEPVHVCRKLDEGSP